MSLVSLDAIVQADATLIVGILFLLTLKQVLKQKVTRDDLKFVASAIILYALSAIAAVFPDPVSSLALVLGFALENPVAVAYMDWLVRMCSFVSILLFYLGMAVTAGAVYWMMRRTEISEREKDKVGDRSDVRKQEEQPRRGVEWTAPLSTSVVTPLERERVRATLVLGLIAAILGLRLWEHALPEPFAWVPTASGVLLLYWLIYVGAAAYGVSEDLFGRGFCGWALWFAHQSFKFAMVVTAIMVA